MIIILCVLLMKVVRSVYANKIISSHRDLVALVFYGTEKSKNPRDSFKHVYVYHDLDEPGKTLHLSTFDHTVGFTILTRENNNDLHYLI